MRPLKPRPILFIDEIKDIWLKNQSFEKVVSKMYDMIISRTLFRTRTTKTRRIRWTRVGRSKGGVWVKYACKLHSNAILGPHPWPSPELAKPPGRRRRRQDSSPWSLTIREKKKNRVERNIKMLKVSTYNFYALFSFFLLIKSARLAEILRIPDIFD